MPNAKHETVGKEALSYEVADILGYRKQPGRRVGPAYKIVGIIFRAIRDALLRGETVRIKGLGTFSVRERHARQTVTYFQSQHRAGWYKAMIVVPAKKYVHFQASPAIRSTP